MVSHSTLKSSWNTGSRKSRKYAAPPNPHLLTHLKLGLLKPQPDFLASESASKEGSLFLFKSGLVKSKVQVVPLGDENKFFPFFFLRPRE